MIAAFLTLGAALGLSLALTFHVIIADENRTLREEDRICQVEQQDRQVDKAIIAGTHVHVTVPPLAGC